MKTLYISYDGAMDPLGRSQIIPYLTGLGQKGLKFTLLTYEKRMMFKDREALFRLKKSLKEKNITWEILQYHKSPSAIATAFDIFVGTMKGFIIVLRDRIKLIHARSFVGAVPALLLVKIFNLKFIFDMRGFWPEERIEGAIWERGCLLYKISKWWEKQFFLNADRIICLTEEAKKIIEGLPYLRNEEKRVDVVPTCVDMEKFRIIKKNNELLEKLYLKERFIFIYFGSLGTWYMLEEMIDFFKAAKQVNPRAFLLMLTPDKEVVFKAMANRLVPGDDFYIDFIPYDKIASWLSIADASIFFIKPTYSKKSSCPTKFGEALACGLPVVINSGIGDLDGIVRSNNIGVIVRGFADKEYAQAARELFGLFGDRDKLASRCRIACENIFALEFGIEKYNSIYNVFNNTDN